MTKRDYYEVLGIGRDASVAEIKKEDGVDGQPSPPSELLEACRCQDGFPFLVGVVAVEAAAAQLGC